MGSLTDWKIGKRWDEVRWDEMRWDGMGWDGMGWYGMGWDGMGWDGVGWDGIDGMGWDGMGWDGMRWDKMRWDEMIWDEMGSYPGQFRPSNPYFRWLPMDADMPMNYHDNNKRWPKDPYRHSLPCRWADSADLSSLCTASLDPDGRWH